MFDISKSNDDREKSTQHKRNHNQFLRDAFAKMKPLKSRNKNEDNRQLNFEKRSIEHKGKAEPLLNPVDAKKVLADNIDRFSEFCKKAYDVGFNQRKALNTPEKELQYVRDTIYNKDNIFKNGIINPTALAGVWLGSAAAEMYGHGLGFDTALHELGHAAAREMLNTNNNISIQIDGIDRLKALGDSNSAADFFHKIGDILGFKDVHGDNAFGVTHNPGDHGLTGLGHSLGKDGSDAAVNIAGSMPALVLDTMIGYLGAKKGGVAGATMATFATTNHIVASLEPIMAASLSNNQMAHFGIDFARFSKDLHIAGASPHEIAVGTAVVFTLMEPVAMLIGRCQHKDPAEVQFTKTIVEKVFQKAEKYEGINKELNKIFEGYSGKGELLYRADEYKKALHIGICDLMKSQDPEKVSEIIKELSKNYEKWDKTNVKFLEHVRKKIPKKERKEIVKEIKNEHGAESFTKKMLTYGTFATFAGISIGKLISQIASRAGTIAPAIGTAVSASLGAVAGVITEGFYIKAAIDDSKNPLLPKKVKFLSKANVALGLGNIAGSITLVTPAAPAGLPILLTCGGCSMGVSLWRQKEIDKRYKEIDESMSEFKRISKTTDIARFNDPEMRKMLRKTDLRELDHWLKLQNVIISGEEHDKRITTENKKLGVKLDDDFKKVLKSTLEGKSKPDGEIGEISNDYLKKLISDKKTEIKKCISKTPMSFDRWTKYADILKSYEDPQKTKFMSLSDMKRLDKWLGIQSEHLRNGTLPKREKDYLFHFFIKDADIHSDEKLKEFLNNTRRQVKQELPKTRKDMGQWKEMYNILKNEVERFESGIPSHLPEKKQNELNNWLQHELKVLQKDRTYTFENNNSLLLLKELFDGKKIVGSPIIWDANQISICMKMMANRFEHKTNKLIKKRSSSFSK